MKIARTALLTVLAALILAAPAAADTRWELATAHLDAAAAMVTEAGAGVLVGSVDSGVAFAHPALAGATLWTNAAEAAGAAGADDDANGCVDDLHGCDVVNGDGDPMDDDGHGTATAGEIVGSGAGYTGVAPRATLIAAKVLDARGAGTTAELAAGLNYVAGAGARVVVVSVGGARSAAVRAAIVNHPGTLFVVAAGNAGADVDGASAAASSYPCTDLADNVLCVAASGRDDALVPNSNHGATSVDLAAPGAGITAPAPGGIATWTGTSFAAPLVAGVAALAFSRVPGATVASVKQALMATADRVPALAGTSVTGGRLNAAAALQALGVPAAAAPAPAAAPQPAAPAPVATTAVSQETPVAPHAKVVKALTAKRSSIVKKRSTGKPKHRKARVKRVKKVTAKRHPAKIKSSSASR